MKKSTMKIAIFLCLLINGITSCKKNDTDVPPVTEPPAKNNIVFIYKGDNSDALLYKSMMNAFSTKVTAIDSAQVMTYDFSTCNLIVAGDNSASFSIDFTDNMAARIRDARKPILFMGVGGTNLAKKISTVSNWFNPSLFTGALTEMPVVDNTNALYKNPVKMNIPASGILQLFTAGSPSFAFFKASLSPLPQVDLIMRADIVQQTFFSVAYEKDKDGFFGYYGTPLSQLTTDGRNFLVNFSFCVGKLSL